jgi:UDP-glucose 4-epimerase
MARDIAVVTGGAGFIGSHMVDLLVARGYQVRVIDNFATGRMSNLAKHERDPEVTVERADILDLEPTSSLFSGVRFVFHFAGIGDIVPSLDAPFDYMRTNCLGTVRVLECARQAGVEKFVYAASSSCFGLADVPTREDHPIEPVYPYALSKYQGEQTALHWCQVYQLPVNSLRIFNTYGRRSRTTGAYGAVLGVFLRQKLAGEPFTVVGDGTQRRDFVYVTDVVRAFLRAAESHYVGEIYNLGTGCPQTVNRLVELLGGETVFVPARPGEPDCTWADISKISAELGWAPEVSFEAGVAQVLMHIEDWHNAPLWNAESIAEATRGWFEALAGGEATEEEIIP